MTSYMSWGEDACQWLCGSGIDCVCVSVCVCARAVPTTKRMRLLSARECACLKCASLTANVSISVTGKPMS